LTQSIQSHYGSGVDSDSNRNEYQEYFLVCKDSRCLATLMCQLSWNLGASTSWNLQGLSRDCFFVYSDTVWRSAVSLTSQERTRGKNTWFRAFVHPRTGLDAAKNSYLAKILKNREREGRDRAVSVGPWPRAWRLGNRGSLIRCCVTFLC
jgi:hypothetical protein